MEFVILTLGIIVFAALFAAIKIVPEQEAWIVQRFEKFHKKLSAGLNFIIPFVDSIAYKQSLKEEVIDLLAQGAITKDNVSMKIDGILYIKILDPIAASYGVTDPYYAISQLAQTTMRSEIGKISLDKTFEEKETLNTNIVTAINWTFDKKSSFIPPESIILGVFRNSGTLINC